MVRVQSLVTVSSEGTGEFRSRVVETGRSLLKGPDKGPRRHPPGNVPTPRREEWCRTDRDRVEIRGVTPVSFPPTPTPVQRSQRGTKNPVMTMKVLYHTNLVPTPTRTSFEYPSGRTIVSFRRRTFNTPETRLT